MFRAVGFSPQQSERREPALRERDQHAMQDIIIIALLGLLIVAVGIYVYLAEKARRRSDRESRSPWDKR
jgi:hypothetical protein